MEHLTARKEILLKHLFVFVAGLSALLSTIPVVAADLTVTITGVRNAHGDLWIAIYDDAEAFVQQNDTKSAAQLKLRARDGTVAFTLRGLAEGMYAVSVMHDENSNAQFDQMGTTPLEGYAYSNSFGSTTMPSFDRAAVTLQPGETETVMKLMYY